MSRSSHSSARSLVCGRGFEPSRVHHEVLAQVYRQVLGEVDRGGNARSPARCRRRPGKTTHPISPVSCGGRCA